MGDFAVDTTIEPQSAGRYRAALCPDWEIWGPVGGYVAAIATRAVGAETALVRPASFFCHYLRPTRFDAIDLHVSPVRRGRSAESWRVHVTQRDREVMDATVCVVAEGEGLEHEVTTCPDVLAPDQLKSLTAYIEEGVVPPPVTPFWDNFDARPIGRAEGWPPSGPADPIWHEWLRFVPTSTFDDPWIDAARYVLLCDLPLWPSTVPQHAWKWGVNRLGGRRPRSTCTWPSTDRCPTSRGCSSTATRASRPTVCWAGPVESGRHPVSSSRRAPGKDYSGESPHRSEGSVNGRRAGKLCYDRRRGS